MYPIEQLYGKTLYTTRYIKTRKPSRWDYSKFEDAEFTAGSPLGVLYSYANTGGKYYLLFDTKTRNAEGRDIDTTFGVEYSPGLIEFSSVKAQGAKDVETVQKEEAEKANDSMFPSIPNPFSGDNMKAVKYVGLGLAALAGVILIVNLTRRR